MIITNYLQKYKDNQEKGIKFYNDNGEAVYCTYGELYIEALKMLSFLKSQGIHKGSELFILIEDKKKYITTVWACLFGGIILIPSNASGHTMNAVLRLKEKCKNPFFITDDIDNHTIQNNLDELGCNKLILYPDISDFTYDEENIAIIEENDVVMVLFTSGSTSEPTGSGLTSRNIHSITKGVIERLKYSEEDIFLSWLPLMHTISINLSHLIPTFLGASQIYIETKSIMKNSMFLLEIAEKEKANIIYTVSSHIRSLTNQSKKNRNNNLDLSCIDALLIGGEPVIQEYCDDFYEEMGKYGVKEHVITPNYGLTEATSLMCVKTIGSQTNCLFLDKSCLNIGQKVSVLKEGDIFKVVSVGEPIKGAALRIVSEAGEELEEGYVGIVCFKGDMITEKYVNDEESDLQEGWLNTGDIGVKVHGELYIIGRQKDMFFLNGKNIYCSDLIGDAVKEVNISRDNIAILLSSGNQEYSSESLICFLICEDKNSFIDIANKINRFFSCEKGIILNNFVMVNSFPKTISGKIKFSQLREKYENNQFPASRVYQINAKRLFENSYVYSDCEYEVHTIINDFANTEISADDNYFEYFNDSMDIYRIHSGIDSRFKDILNISDMFQFMTVKELSAYLWSHINDNQANVRQ